MTKSTSKHKKTKAVNPCQEHFGVNENLLKFFPKASPMGFSKPTKWVYAENHNLGNVAGMDAESGRIYG